MSEDIASIRRAVRDIPDFPKPGIVFRDITPLLGNGALFGKTIDILAERYRDQKIDTVLGMSFARVDAVSIRTHGGVGSFSVGRVCGE